MERYASSIAKIQHNFTVQERFISVEGLLARLKIRKHVSDEVHNIKARFEVSENVVAVTCFKYEGIAPFISGERIITQTTR